MSTRTYDRNTLEWEQGILDALVADGSAKAFPTPQGVHYVVKIDNQSFGIRPSQIRVEAPAVSDVVYQESLDYLRSQIVDHDTEIDYLEAVSKQATLDESVSVAELTDGEYTTDLGVIVKAYDDEDETWEAVRRQEDALLARFGV